MLADDSLLDDRMNVRFALGVLFIACRLDPSSFQAIGDGQLSVLTKYKDAIAAISGQHLRVAAFHVRVTF